jgi:hypothetical protein
VLHSSLNKLVRGVDLAESREERKFLHDIASPLGTAIFLVDAFLEDLTSKPNPDADGMAQVSAIYQALQSIQKLLQERRETLIRNGSNNQNS